MTDSRSLDAGSHSDGPTDPRVIAALRRRRLLWPCGSEPERSAVMLWQGLVDSLWWGTAIKVGDPKESGRVPMPAELEPPEFPDYVDTPPDYEELRS